MTPVPEPDAERRGAGEPPRGHGPSPGREAPAGGRAARSGGSDDPDAERARARERELVSRASKGDVAAFAKLVRAHSGRVRRVTRRMLGSRDAEDAAQEVWIRVWANMKGFKGNSAFGTWLYRIAMNVCLDARSRMARQDGREDGEGALPYLPEPVGADGDAEAAALNSERREELQAALGGVRAEHRKVLVLRHVEGLSYSEIAGVLGVPEGTAKGWGTRGRAAMLAALSRKERAASGRGPDPAPPGKGTKTIPAPSPAA